MEFPVLKTTRLELVRLEEEHLEDMHAIYQDEESMLYWDDFPHKDVSETREIFDLLAERITEGTGLCWGMKLKGGKELIGTISYNRYRKGGLATIGYILARKHWGKGMMTEALVEAVRYAFEGLEVHRIEAHVQPGNVASEKVLSKLGFQKEGLLRERHYYKDKHQDMIVYGLLRTDCR